MFQQFSANAITLSRYTTQSSIHLESKMQKNLCLQIRMQYSFNYGGVLMKRVSCLFLSFLLAISLGIPSALAAASTMDEATVKRAAEDYLSQRMRKVYFYENYNDQNSVKTLLDMASAVSSSAKEKADTRLGESMQLIPEQETLCTFIEGNEPELMASMNRKEISVSDMVADLQCMEDMTAYKSHVYMDQGFSYSDFDATYHFSDLVIDGNFATVVVYEELNYQYDDCDQPSYELGEYNLVLIQVDGEWVVADVASDDIAFMGYFENGYDLDAAISSYDSAMKAARRSLASGEVSANNEALAEEWNGELLTAANSDIAYNKQNAVNYALTYTTSADDGSATPSYRNTRFHWFGADCMNFCSQAVWAGFGGSNSWSDVPAKNGMDTTGSATWWCTNTTGTSSWASCSAFRTYVGNVSADSTGLVCAKDSIGGSENTLPFSASQLVGSVLHVEGSVNNVPTAKAHAVFVNAASGNTRSTVMVCSYNRCRKNVKLSSVCPVGGSTKAIEVIVPQTFKGGKPSLFICGSLLNAINTQGASRALAGYSNVTLSELNMTLLKPDGSTAGTWKANNATSVTGTYSNWNVSGEWILKLTGTTSSGASKTWYGSIRVILK